MSARLTSEIESGSLLPTPAASMVGYNRGGSAGRVGKIRPSLEMMASKDLWPTPVAADCGRGSGTYARGNLTLTGAVKIKPIWMTPTVQDSNGRDRHNQRNGRTVHSLLGQVRMWPTPTAHDHATPKTPAQIDAMKERYRASGRNPPGVSNLNEAVSLETFPTPMARDGDPKRGMPSKELAISRLASGRRNLEDQIAALGPATGGRVLNPDWVELLMGWPKGWTRTTKPAPGKADGKTGRRERSDRRMSPTGWLASKPSGTVKSRSARRSHGGC